MAASSSSDVKGRVMSGSLMPGERVKKPAGIGGWVAKGSLENLSLIRARKRRQMSTGLLLRDAMRTGHGRTMPRENGIVKRGPRGSALQSRPVTDIVGGVFAGYAYGACVSVA